ncbi:site-specific integrase [Natronospora cellulosivora (SeqCode)]
MNLVQPIRDKKKIEEMKTELLRKNYRDYILFLVGINTGLRVSDILKLKVADVKEKTHIMIKEQKTGKSKRIFINNNLRLELDKYIANLNDDTYLFVSNKGENSPISRRHAYRILKEVGDSIGLKEVGTHTMRKTFGYWHYQQYHDVALLQELFNHSAPSVTLKYIGINQDLMDESLKEFSL